MHNGKQRQRSEFYKGEFTGQFHVVSLANCVLIVSYAGFELKQPLGNEQVHLNKYTAVSFDFSVALEHW